MLNYSNPAAIVAEATRRLARMRKSSTSVTCQSVLKAGCANCWAARSQTDARALLRPEHFGWWTSIEDLQGNDLMPQLGNMSLSMVMFHRSKIRILKRLERHLCKSAGCPGTGPGYITNTYLKYYLFPDYVVQHSNPNIPARMR